MWLFPLHSALFFVWGCSFRNACRWDSKDRGWKERMPREPYITDLDGIQINQKGRWGLLLWSWQLCFSKCRVHLLPDGMGSGTGDTHAHRQVYMCAHVCREPTHIQRSIWDSFFFLPLDALEKNTVTEKDVTMSCYCHPLRVCPCVCVCVHWGTQCVCQQPPTMCHNISWSKSITETSFTSSITVFDGSECEQLRGSFAAGCPLSKTMHESRGKVEEKAGTHATW